MATIPYPSKNTMIDKKVITIQKKRILLTTHETTDAIHLYFGGYNNIYCLHISLYKKDSIFARMINCSIATLEHIYFNEECTLDRNFKRGVDTNMLLQFGIKYIHDKYPHIQYLRFIDASYRTCDNNQTVNLYELQYITTGKTWYENKYNAFIEEKGQEEAFRKAERDFQSLKSQISWTHMKQIMNVSSDDEETMKLSYEESNTWQEFFGKIHDRIGVSNFCMFVAPWLASFMMNYSKMQFTGTKYLMPIVKYDMEYVITNYKKGGSNYTRKRRNHELKNYM
jgi:hypothetical protein